MLKEQEEAASPRKIPVESVASPEPVAESDCADSPSPESTREPTELERAESERDQAIEEKNELLDRFQRAQAEFENVRKRADREGRDLREYAAMATIESLLPILDDFDRAIEAEGAEPEYRQGLELIRRRIADVLERAGLEVVEETGSFDPNLHQAVDRAPAESEEEDQAILETYQRGYKFKDRLLRPAMVKVAVKE